MGEKIGDILSSLGDSASGVSGIFEKHAKAKEDKAYRDAMLANLTSRAADTKADKDRRLKKDLLMGMARQGKWTPDQFFQAAQHAGLWDDGEDTSSPDPLDVSDPNALKAFDGISFDAQGRQTSGGGGGGSSSLAALIKGFGGAPAHKGRGGRGHGGGGGGKTSELFGGKQAPYADYDPDTGDTTMYSVPSQLKASIASQISSKRISPSQSASMQKDLQSFLHPKPRIVEGAPVPNENQFLQKLGGSVEPAMTQVVQDKIQRGQPENIIASILKAAQGSGLVKPAPTLPGGMPTAPAASNAATGPMLAPQDQQAIQWAQTNPNDPRAIKILQLHGL